MEEKSPNRVINHVKLKIPSGWEWKNLNNLCKIKIGGTPKTGESSFWNGPIKWATAKDVANTTGRFIQKTEKTITREGSDRSAAKILPANSIVITARGTVGKMAITSEQMAINQTCYGLLSEDIDNMFLYYSVKSAIEKILSVSYGTVFDTITIKSFEEIKLSVPKNRTEQKAIAKILSDLDSKIELNRKMNKTLEAIAQAIFKHWFIDFEFPNEDGKPYKSSGGEMVDSELGEIPKGWELKQLGDLTHLEKGLSYKGKFLSTSGNPLINLGCISPKDGFIKEGVKYYNGDFSKRHTVRVRDILIANTDITQKREILGSPVIVPDNIDMRSSIIFTHHLYAVRLLDSVESANKEFVYGIMKTRSYGDYVKTYATGTTVLAIPKESVLNYKFAYPSEILIESFSNLSKTIMDKIQNNKNANNSLLAVRDSLLPKLMSGRIRVPLEE